jgi:hypothetical protein
MRRPNSYRVMARDAERYFPVRIRVDRDQLGREQQYDTMTRWLDHQIGPGRYWFVGAMANGAMPHCLLFYFVAVADAQAFIDRFSCGVWVAGEWPHTQGRITDESDASWIGDLHRT